MGFMELRAVTIGFRVPSLPIFLTVSATLPNGSRAEETVNNKTQTQGKSFCFYFCREMKFRTYFVYFHRHSLVNSKSNELQQSLGCLWENIIINKKHKRGT